MAACTPAGTSTRPVDEADLAGQLGPRRWWAPPASGGCGGPVPGRRPGRRPCARRTRGPGRRPPARTPATSGRARRRRRNRTSLPSGSAPARSSMAGQVRPVWMPSTRCMVGRRARWSSSASVSKVATSSLRVAAVMVSSAVPAPSPASIQPSSTTISSGRLEVGALDELEEVAHSASRPMAVAGRLDQRDDLLRRRSRSRRRRRGGPWRRPCSGRRRPR